MSIQEIARRLKFRAMCESATFAGHVDGKTAVQMIAWRGTPAYGTDMTINGQYALGSLDSDFFSKVD